MNVHPPTGPFRVWLARQRVRLALRRTDGSPERERAVIDAFDAFVATEHRRRTQ
jgi:hypothetical protein